MDSSTPGSSIHGIFQARVLEWVAISFSYVSILIKCFDLKFILKNSFQKYHCQNTNVLVPFYAQRQKEASKSVALATDSLQNIIALMLVLTGEQKAEILIHLSIQNSWEPEE